MASLFAHGVVAVAMGKLAARPAPPIRFWVAAVLCSILPDADVIGFRFGIRYEDMLGHRGLSHSLAFAAVVGAIATWLVFPAVRTASRAWWHWWALFSAITASHSVLDAMTDGGLGVAFFSPLDSTRYFFPFRPIAVSPIGISEFFTHAGLRVIGSELLWIGLPSVACIVVAGVLRRRRASRPTDSAAA